MQYKPSDRYSELRVKLFITKSFTREEAQEFMRLGNEESARQERFAEILDGFHERQAQERLAANARREAFIRSLDRDTTGEASRDEPLPKSDESC